jgi:hypothetical protein
LPILFERTAEAIRGGVDKTILQLHQRLLVVPEGADLKEFILSGGQILQPVAPLIVPTGVLPTGVDS